jgi:hypothetical protein
MIEAFCFKCKVKRRMENPMKIMLKNGRPSIQGTCSVCGTKMLRITKMKKKADSSA